MAEVMFKISKDELLALVKVIHGERGSFLSDTYKSCTNTGDHFASDVSGLVLETLIKDGEKVLDSLVVKRNPGKKATKVLNEVMALQFEKEAAFYREILPLLNTELKSAGEVALRTPKFFHAELTPGDELLVLSNMNDEKYYTLDRKESLAIDAIKMVIAELARLHAASVLVQAKHTVNPDALKEIYFEFINSKESEIFSNSYEHYAELASDYDHPDLAQFFRTNKMKAQEVFQQLLKTTDKFKVINHGEPWIPNFLFKKEDEKFETCALVDFQLIRLGSPALDLNQLFFTCLDGDARKAHVKDYLDYYYETFEGVLSKAKFDVPFTKEELVKEYQRKNLFGYIMMIDSMYKVKCEDSHCLKPSDFINEEMGAIETRRRAYVKSRKDLMSTRLSALFSEMAVNESFQTDDIDAFIKNLNEH